MNSKLKTLWENRKQIAEGVMNTIFIKEEIEVVAAERKELCMVCDNYDEKGTGCLVPGSQPCCSNLTGGCGCSIAFKTRSMSSSCPLKQPKWTAVISQEVEDEINNEIE